MRGSPTVGDGWYCGTRHRRGEVDIIEAFIQDFTMRGRDTIHLEDQQRKSGCFGMHFCPFLGCEGVPHSPRLVVWWSETQGRLVDIIETLFTSFYNGKEGYYPLRASKKENGVFRGTFLPNFRL